MKKAFLFIALFISCNSFSQNDSTTKTEPIVCFVEQMPSFPGGELEMMKFLQKNLKYPEREKEANISGTCYLTFIVEKDGSINDVNILRGVPNGPGCVREAIRLVKLMPNWIPGKQNCREVRVQFNLPIKFTLRSKDYISETDTTYYYTDWQIGSKVDAKFYRFVSKNDNGYVVNDMYINKNTPQRIAICSSVNPLVKNGKCKFYYESGQKEKEGNYITGRKEGLWTKWDENGHKLSEGKYVNDKKDGIWIDWFEGGKDSTIVECFENGTYKNIRILQNQTINDKFDVFYKIEEMPVFPGGESEMMKYIATNVNYPQSAKDANITGTCYVTFVIEKDGTVTNARILKGITNGSVLDNESLRVINLMPKWKPGLQYGRISRFEEFNLPIKFTLR